MKSCVELLRSCGITILVVFSEIPEFCLDYKLPATKNIRTSNTGGLSLESGIQLTVCLFTVSQERIATWKEVAVLWKQVVASGRVLGF